MNSDNVKNTKKISSQSRTLGFNSFKRTLWVPVVWSVIVSVICTTGYNYYSVLRNVDNVETLQYLLSELNDLLPVFAVSIVFAAFFGAIQFSYLTKVNSVGFIHSLPISRNKIFASYYISGIVSVVIPQIVMMLHFLMIPWKYTAVFALLTFAVGTVYSVGVYSFAVMMSMFSAKTIGCVLFTVFGLAVPVIAESFIRIIMQNELYGYCNKTEYLSVRYIYLMPENVMSLKGLIYAAAIILFTLFAWLLFKKRPSELAGDLVAFSGIRGLTTAICGIVAGFCGYLIFGGSLLLFALFGIICSILVNFAVKKKLELKSSLASAGVIVAVTAALYVVFVVDVTFFEKRIPDTEDIQSVRVYDAYRGEDRIYFGNSDVGYLDKSLTEIDYEKGIEVVREFHKDLLGNENYYYSNSDYVVNTVSGEGQYIRRNRDNFNNIIVEYKLRNGKTLIRQYRAYLIKNRETLMRVSALPEMKIYDHEILREDVGVSNMILETPVGETKLSAEETQRVREALCRDIINSSPENSNEFNDFRTFSSIGLSYEYKYLAVIYKDGRKINISEVAEGYMRNGEERIYPHYTETLQVLRELGYGAEIDFENLPNDFTVSIEKHKSRNENDTGTKTDVYYPVYVYDKAYTKTLLNHMFSMSAVKCEHSYGTSYKITFPEKYNKYSSITLYGEEAFIESWLSGQEMKIDYDSGYYGLPYDNGIYFYEEIKYKEAASIAQY